MSSGYLETEAVVKGPAEDERNFSAAVGTTHAVYEVHPDWQGRRVDIVVHGHVDNKDATVWILFGESAAVEADPDAVVTGTPPAWTANPNTARPIPAGQDIDRYIDPAWTHFSVVSDDDTNQPKVSIFPSDYAPTEL